MKRALWVSGVVAACALLVGADTLPSFENTPPEKRVPGQLYVDEGGQKIYWPKALVSAADVYGGKIHKYPQPRRGYTDKNLITEGFAYDRLGPIPPPGEHPRLYVTPADFQRMRDNVALGEKAPRLFRTLWTAMLEQGQITKDGKLQEIKPAEFTGTGYSLINDFLRQAIYAQVMNDDKLGRALAENLYKASQRDLKVLDLFDTRPERDNVWVVTDTRWLPDGHEYKKYGQWYWPSYPEAYDYSWRWLKEDERASVRKVIARLQADRYTHFMELPTSRHLINHASMAMLWMSYPLVIEGEEGYNRKNYEFARQKYEEVLEYYISPDGTMYENVKGFLPWQVYLSIARRENGRILQHPHIFNHMRRMLYSANNVQNDYIGWVRPPVRANTKDNKFAAEFLDPRGGLNSRSWELRTSGHPLALLSMMNWFYPNRKDFDFIMKTACHTNNFDFYLDKSLSTWMPEVGAPAIMLAFATDGISDKDGKPIDWNKSEVDFEKKTSYVDLERGVCEMRSDWSRDALQLTMECRSDFYTGGHETPEFGNFNFVADGIAWAPYFGAYQPAMHRNVVTVDGKNGEYPPAACRFVSLDDQEISTTAVVDYSIGMQFKEYGRNDLLLHPKLKIPFHEWMAPWYNWDRNRKFQMAFQPHNRWFDEYQASVDFGHWDGQNTGGTWYERILPEVTHAWRTLQMVKGKNPFLLVIDDIKLGEEQHAFQWNLNLNPDIVLIRQPSPDEMIFGRYDISARRVGVSRPLEYAPEKSGKNKQGEPLLYVRVLNRDTKDEFPHPSFENMDGKAMAVVPAKGIDPAFKVLVFPYREGDALPAASWSEDKSRLSINVGEDQYLYVFGKADNGRSVFTLSKNGKLVQVDAGLPAKPVFADMPPAHQPSRYKLEGPELGPPPQKPNPSPVPVKLFTDSAELKFESSGPGMEIRYTINGTLPGKDSILYSGPVKIDKTATVKAITCSREWSFGKQPFSEVSEASFIKETPLAAKGAEGLENGLLCNVYEIFVPEWDTDGFINPKLNLMPQLEKYKPILTTATKGFELPAVLPQKPIEEIYKGFYNFKGYIKAEQDGTCKFDIQSNGPVNFVIDGKKVIEENGLYHQDLKSRYGQVALQKGMHQIELTVCDPIFWRKGREGDMPFKVKFSVDQEGFKDLTNQMCYASASDLKKFAENKFAPKVSDVPLLKAVTPDVPVTKGLMKTVYNMSDLTPASGGWLFSSKAGPAGLFDIGTRKPLSTRVVTDLIEGSDYDGQAYEYAGWYKAPYDGLYKFVLDGKGNNQLGLDGKIIVQNNVPGAQVDGRVRLEKGYHALSLKFGRSVGIVEVQSPVNTNPERLTFGDLYCPEKPKLIENPENYLVLGLGEDAYAKEEQKVSTMMGDYRFRVEGVQVVDDEQMGKAVEFRGGKSGLRLFDWPCPGRYITMSFWIKLPQKSPRKDFLQIGREGATGSMDSRGVSIGFPRFYVTGNNVSIKEMEEGKWVYLTLEWGPYTKIYVNGKLRNKVYTAGDPCMGQRPENHNARSAQMQLFVGGDGSFKGRIAGLKVYDTLLEDDYVLQLYEKSKKPKE